MMIKLFWKRSFSSKEKINVILIKNKKGKNKYSHIEHVIMSFFTAYQTRFHNIKFDRRSNKILEIVPGPLKEITKQK